MGLNQKFEGQGSRFSKVISPKIQRLERNINVGGLGYNPRNFEVIKNSSPNIGPTPISYTFNTKEELQTGVNLWISNNAEALETYGEINTWVIASTITDMSQLFLNKTTFNSDISNWDVSNVTNMNSMFRGTASFNQSLNSWDVSKVTNMSFMFRSSGFNQPINSWDVSSVTDMTFMFNQSNTFNQPIGDWDVSNVTTMAYMFNTSQFNQPIGNWDVSTVTNMNLMFYGATLFNQDLSGWCVSNIPSEPSDFSTNSALTTGNKPVWGTCPS